MSEKNTLKLQLRNVFGNDYIYPMCETSKILIELTRQKTFDEAHLKTLKKLGYEFEFVAQTVET